MAGGKQNGGLPTVAVSRAMLATARGRKKLDLILEAPDPKAFVRQLPAEDLYFAIREIGQEDAGEIIALASPLQFRAFVDLDVWRKSLPDPQRVLGWMELASSTVSGYRAKRAALDKEVVLIVLKHYAHVHSLEENEDPEYQSSNLIRTAEGKYVIEIGDEGPEGMAARRLIQDFIEENPFEATRLFEATRWESQAELEETAYRWRTGRMRDMGFPELEEALRIWAPLPKDWTPQTSSVEPGPVTGVPALLLVSSRAPLFLDRVVEQLPDATRPFFNEGLIYLLNCAIVADGIDPRDLDLARDTLSATRDMLSLGLELAAQGSEAAALQVLGSTAPVELFRLAVTRVVTLGRTATAILRPIAQKSGLTPLDAPDSEILAALRRKRPRFYDPPEEGAPARPAWRAFRTPADLAKTESVLQRARAAVGALGALGLDAAKIEALADASGRAVTAVSVSQILLTAAVQGSRSPAPLPASDVPRLCGLFEGGRLKPGPLQQWFADLRGLLAPELQAAFDEVSRRALARFEDEIGPPCVAGGVEAPFIDCLLIAGTRPPAEVQAH